MTQIIVDFLIVIVDIVVICINKESWLSRLFAALAIVIFGIVIGMTLAGLGVV